MRIMFTNNLSKMVAHYENLLTQYPFDTLNTSAIATNIKYQLNLWIYSYICNNIVDISGLERNVINMMDKTCWQKKPWV